MPLASVVFAAVTVAVRLPAFLLSNVPVALAPNVSLPTKSVALRFTAVMVAESLPL